MSMTAKAHGMDGSLVEPDWPPLTLAEVRELLAAFPGCGEPIEILSVSPRLFSAASVVAAGSGRVFIKRHHRTVRDREGLLEEHRFLNHLRVHGAPVPRVFENSSGETAIESGQWTFEVHEAMTGVDIYEEALSWTPFRSTAHARSAGEALARLHQASQGFDAPLRKTQPLVASLTIFAADDPSAPMKRYLAARPALAEDAVARFGCEEVLELLVPLHAQLRPLLSALKPLWTHNDPHASNFLWSDASDKARAVAVIDFHHVAVTAHWSRMGHPPAGGRVNSAAVVLDEVDARMQLRPTEERVGPVAERRGDRGLADQRRAHWQDRQQPAETVGCGDVARCAGERLVEGGRGGIDRKRDERAADAALGGGRDERVGGQHQRIREPLRHRARFAIGVDLHQLTRRHLLLMDLLDAGGHYLEVETQVAQQLLPPRGSRGEN